MSMSNLIDLQIEENILAEALSTFEIRVQQLVAEVQIKKENEQRLSSMLEQCNGWTLTSEEALRRTEAAESEALAATAAAIRLSTERDIAIRQTTSLQAQVDVLTANESKLKTTIQDLQNANSFKEQQQIQLQTDISRLLTERDNLIAGVNKVQQTTSKITNEFQRLSDMYTKLKSELGAAVTLHSQQREENLKCTTEIKNLVEKVSSTVKENIALQFQVAEMKNAECSDLRCAACNAYLKKQ